MKPQEEKSHKLWSKTHNQKTNLKDPQRVVKKTSQVPTFGTSVSHRDLTIFNYQTITRMKWNGENWNIQNITWLADETGTLSIQNVSWNVGDLNKIIV